MRLLKRWKLELGRLLCCILLRTDHSLFLRSSRELLMLSFFKPRCAFVYNTKTDSFSVRKCGFQRSQVRKCILALILRRYPPSEKCTVGYFSSCEKERNIQYSSVRSRNKAHLEDWEQCIATSKLTQITRRK